MHTSRGTLKTALLRPTYIFQADPDTTAAEYESAVCNGYVTTLGTLCGAAEAFSLSVDNATLERWKRLSAATGMIDDALDQSPDKNAVTAHYFSALSAVLHGSNPSDILPIGTSRSTRLAITLLYSAVEELPPEALKTMVISARRIGQLATDKSVCSNATEYCLLLREEAAETNVLVAETCTPGLRAQGSFQEFSSWTAKALVFATLADSTRDIWADYRAGRTGVAPSPKAIATLTLQSWQAARDLYKDPGCLKATISAIYCRAKLSVLPTKLTLRAKQSRIRRRIKDEKAPITIKPAGEL